MRGGLAHRQFCQSRSSSFFQVHRMRDQCGLSDPRMKARITDFGCTVFASSHADFGTFIAAYTEKWAKVIKFAGAKVY